MDELRGEYSWEGRRFLVCARRKDAFFGHGIILWIEDESATIRMSTIYMCHPEFPYYVEYQSMGTNELLRHALKHLENGDHAEVAASSTSDIPLLYVINRKDASPMPSAGHTVGR